MTKIAYEHKRYIILVVTKQGASPIDILGLANKPYYGLGLVRAWPSLREVAWRVGVGLIMPGLFLHGPGFIWVTPMWP